MPDFNQKYFYVRYITFLEYVKTFYRLTFNSNLGQFHCLVVYYDNNEEHEYWYWTDINTRVIKIIIKSHMFYICELVAIIALILNLFVSFIIVMLFLNGLHLISSVCFYAVSDDLQHYIFNSFIELFFGDFSNM